MKLLVGKQFGILCVIVCLLMVLPVHTKSQTLNLVGELAIPGEAWDVYVYGNVNYVAAWDEGLQISYNPNPPIPLGSCQTPGEAHGVFARGVVGAFYAYVADGSSGLQVIDASDPYRPQIVGSIATPGGRAYDVFVSGSYAYIADDGMGSNDGLYIYNVANPSNPTFVGSYLTSGSCCDVYVRDSYAYVAGLNFLILDVSNPASPSLAGSLAIPGALTGVDLVGDTAYVSSWSYGLYIVDISDPENPVQIGYHDTPQFIYDVKCDGEYTYEAHLPAGLRVYDISDPSNPVFQADQVFNDALSSSLFDGFIYVASYTSGLKVFKFYPPQDEDNDGFTSDIDCDDNDPHTFPGAAPNDSPTECMRDSDLDDYGDIYVSGEIIAGTDCDDTDADIYPGAEEIPDDGIDQDCNGFDAITCVVDADQDGYGTDAGTPVIAYDGSCDVSQGESDNALDCDDGDTDVNPGATEVVDDGIDQDCNGYDAITCIVDADHDGYGTDAETPVIAYDGSCDVPQGESDNALDCNDGDADVNPGATDVCNGEDDNCDGTSDESFGDNDGDGWGNSCDICPDIYNPSQEIICGDSNADCGLNVGDAVFLINYVFKSGPAPDPVCVGDANGDAETNVGDAVYLINYVFNSGPAPVAGCCR